MAASSFMPCPACGVDVPAASFCDACGATLDDAVTIVETAGSQPQESVPAQPESAIPPVLEQLAPAEPRKSHAPAIKLEIDEMRVFITGVHSSFGFRLSGSAVERDAVHDLEIELRIHGRQPSLKEKRRNLPRGEWNISFHNMEPGLKIPVEVGFSCHIDGLLHRYEGDFLFDCYPPEEPPGKIIENLVVKADENRSEYAATQNISVRVMENFTGQGAASLPQQMKALKVNPVWRPIPLSRCYASDLEEIFLHALPSLAEPVPAVDRLTLSSLHKRIHVFCQDTITLGRSASSCDIPCRLYDRRGVQDRDRSSRISRAHARIMAEPHKVWIADGGYDKERQTVRESACGTLLDAGPVRFNKPRELPVDKPFTLQMADFVLRGMVYSLGSFGACPTNQGTDDRASPAAVVLERVDGRSDIYCMLIRAMALKRFDAASFRREFVLRHLGAPVLAAPRGAKFTAAWMEPNHAHCPGLPSGWSVGPFDYSDQLSGK